MIPDNVTLVVKAPNQQIDDQSVECQSSWTVLELKGHLSEVYPSKPRTEEQKIIYSGQLLEDNIILKDVLRTYESQIAHTMHLVCAPTRKMSEAVRTTPDATPAAEAAPDGVRRRTVDSAESVPRPEMRQNDQNHTVEMQNYLSSYANNYGRVPPPYPNYNMGENPSWPNNPMMANQLMVIQQAYVQYMQQVANVWQANQQPVPPETPPTAPPQPPADAPQQEQNDEGAARDWLDHVYTASRLAILSSLVYLYGSGARVLLVIVLVVAGYLHQIGFFRDLNLNNQRNDNNQPPANQPENQPADNDQPADNNQPADNQPSQPNQPANVPDNQPSLLAVTWMIFSTFFASLIPDVNQ